MPKHLLYHTFPVVDVVYACNYFLTRMVNMLELVVALAVTGVLRCTHVKGEDPTCKIYYLVLGSSRKISCFSSTARTHSLSVQPLKTNIRTAFAPTVATYLCLNKQLHFFVVVAVFFFFFSFFFFAVVFC